MNNRIHTFFIFLFIGSFFGLNAQAKDKILIVTSNQQTYGTTSNNAANHFAEIVLAYDVFIKSGYEVDFVSPEGGAIPIGYIETSNKIQKQYLYSASFMNQLKKTKNPVEVINVNYKAIYYSGGGAAMFGVPENVQIQRIASGIYKNGGIVSAVCHGTAGIVNIKDTKGNYLVSGKKVNGYPDAFERTDAAYYKAFPFSIEQRINAHGGDFSYSANGWDGYFIVDGRLITGQDPTATVEVAKAVVQAISKI